MKDYAKRIGRTGMIIKVISDSMEQLGNNICKQYGTTIGQMRLLGAIYYADKSYCSMKELEHIFQVSQATMQGLVNRTAKKGLVEVQLDTKDKRRKNVYLLAAGKELFEKAIPCLFQTEKQLTKGLSPTEIQQLQNILYKVIKNV